MPTAEKVREVEELRDLLANSPLAILTDYRGLTVADIQGLRARLRPVGSNIRVVKNTLTKIAAEQAGVTGLDPYLEGPTALVTATEDPVAPAKIVTEFARTSRILQLKAAVLEGSVISAQGVEELASLPPREVLLGRVVGQMQAPVYGLVNVLAGTIRSLAYVLQARAEQLGGGEEQAA